MATALTERQKIAHLYRRLGFGATPSELDAAEKEGLRKTIDRLIDFEVEPEPSPYEFYWREKEEPDLGSWRTRCWWAYNMLTTRTPLREKLALFWHSHFAVSDAKVEDGPMMLAYLQTLRRLGAGKFPDLLTAMAKEPAMMRYLDMERALRGRPNENFAREVMELFTLGIGHYEEDDVKEVARALTGWGYLNTFWEMPGNTDQKLRDALRDGRPFSAFVQMEAMRDDRPKTILGKTKDWKGEETLDLLAKQSATAHRTAYRLWEFFAYENPEEAPVRRVADAFLRSQGDIRKTMHELVRSPEFWSEKAVRNLMKSPVDFCIGIARAQGIGPALAKLRNSQADDYTMIPQPIIDNAGHLAWRMERMGLSLLYPNDVSGWKWGSAWASAATMAERQQFTGLMIWGQKGADVGSLTPLEYVKSQKPTDAAGIARALCELFDVALPEASMKVLTQAIGDPNVLDDPNNWAGRFNQAVRVLIAAPEAHLM